VRQACVDLLRFGLEIEVLAPPELRAKMAEQAKGLHAIYEDQAATAARSFGLAAAPA
jgi:hypothetical protein